jgi:nucleoside 2-deoxyribosyltransferase
MKIYLAGPISGREYNEIIGRYAAKISLLSDMGYDVYCPMTGRQYMRNDIKLKASGTGNPLSINHAIVERDRWMVSNVDIVLADLTNSGERVSIGTLFELAWASLLGKHTIIIIPKENIHRHAFVLESGDIIFDAEEDAYDYLKDLISGMEA